MNKLNAFVFVFITLNFLMAGASWADYQAGENAYIRGDYKIALQEWGPLAANGDAEAQNMLGYMYRYGQGVPQDYAQALEWYRRSATQGNPTAQNNLGVLYRHGLGVQQDYQEALRWFRRAADQGNGGAQNHLGLMYFRGEGVAKDYILAYMWATLAAEQGLEQAALGLEMLVKEMTPDQIAEARRLAREWRPKEEVKNHWERPQPLLRVA